MSGHLQIIQQIPDAGAHLELRSRWRPQPHACTGSQASRSMSEIRNGACRIRNRGGCAVRVGSGCPSTAREHPHRSSAPAKSSVHLPQYFVPATHRNATRSRRRSWRRRPQCRKTSASDPSSIVPFGRGHQPALRATLVDARVCDSVANHGGLFGEDLWRTASSAAATAVPCRGRYQPASCLHSVHSLTDSRVRRRDPSTESCTIWKLPAGAAPELHLGWFLPRCRCGKIVSRRRADVVRRPVCRSSTS